MSYEMSLSSYDSPLEIEAGRKETITIARIWKTHLVVSYLNNIIGNLQLQLQLLLLLRHNLLKTQLRRLIFGIQSQYDPNRLLGYRAIRLLGY